MNHTIDRLKYPVGPFEKKDHYTASEREILVDTIEKAPARFRAILDNIPEIQLQHTYRPGSWNIRQLIHHVADIQLLHYFRMKKAITETNYTEVTLIDMDAWVATQDGSESQVTDSLLMLDGITRRYAFQIRSLTDSQLEIAYYHPIRKYSINQSQAIAMSAWHLEHHLAHIKLAMASGDIAAAQA